MTHFALCHACRARTSHEFKGIKSAGCLVMSRLPELEALMQQLERHWSAHAARCKPSQGSGTQPRGNSPELLVKRTSCHGALRLGCHSRRQVCARCRATGCKLLMLTLKPGEQMGVSIVCGDAACICFNAC